jgi:hypothetical protein
MEKSSSSTENNRNRLNIKEYYQDFDFNGLMK